MSDNIGIKKCCDYYGLPIVKNKKMSCSNWAETRGEGFLTEAQIQYAAEDAWYSWVCAKRVEKDLEVVEKMATEAGVVA